MTSTVARDAPGNVLDVEPISRLLQRIVQEFNPVEVRFAGYRLRRELRARADIVLCTSSEFAEDRDTPNTLAYEAAHHGVVIHEC